jgi:hypothetical protein
MHKSTVFLFLIKGISPCRAQITRIEFSPSKKLTESGTIFHAKLTAAQIFMQPENSLQFIKKTTHYSANKSGSLPYILYQWIYFNNILLLILRTPKKYLTLGLPQLILMDAISLPLLLNKPQLFSLTQHSFILIHFVSLRLSYTFKIAGSNPAEAVGFFGRNNPQHVFLRRGSKTVYPMSQLCGM